MDQKPTVGRIVHYRAQVSNRKVQPYPAVITHVWGDACVNLSVLPDGSYPLDNHVPTSVMLGEEQGQWSWPPRN